MNRYLTQMLYLPVTVLVTSLDMVGKALRNFAGSSNIQSVGAQSNPAGFSAGTVTKPIVVTTLKKEDPIVDDQDLSGDDLKSISYSILFTKRDYEATLEKDANDLVAYSTDPGSYGGLRIARFMKRMEEGRTKPHRAVELPPKWRDDTSYPPDTEGIPNRDDKHLFGIPEEDQRYIAFKFRVVSRTEKAATDYERRQTRALEGISDALKRGVDVSIK